MPSATPPPDQPTPFGQTGNWNLKFRDEFNGTALDGTKWAAAWDKTGPIYGPVNDAETTCYDTSHLLFPGDGSLHLRLDSQSATCKGVTRPYRGALIHSNGHFNFSYGYYEVRAYLPASSPGAIANWPAIWSDGQNWPFDGEIDTVEGLGGQAKYYFHYANEDGTEGKEGYPVSGDYTGWHIFASDWEPGSITYYYDGKQVGQITTGITSAAEYLILDNTQGQWGGRTIVPAEMQVDYVRVWQH